MLRVIVDLEPYGNRRAARRIAEVEIVNTTGNSLRLSQDYAWRIRESEAGVLAMGWLVDWKRQKGPLTLVAAVIDEWQSGRGLPYDNHGRPARPSDVPTPEEFWRRHDEEREDEDDDE